MRKISKVAKEWWDYTSLDDDILEEAAILTADDILRLQRPGFTVRFFETSNEFFLAEALEYIQAF